ncbi:phosphoribosylformylglycinamidine cyclo-ligase [candidate division KSB1 bacterium]
MGIPEYPKDVKLVVAVTFQNSDQLQKIEEFLVRKFGPIETRTDISPFSYTDYYRDEMGENLLKIFFSFTRLFKRENLPRYKLLTNHFEQSSAEGGRRTVNIDPGYISEANLVLASTKNFTHRIYIGEGIFGDCHLYFKHGEFRPMSWTYPDYKEPEALRFFAHVREVYYRQVSGQAAPKSVSYKDAGVDIGEGDRAVDSIKEMVKRTFGPNVLTELGKFGGFYAPDLSDYDEPVLVSSVDGVGTKLKIAFMTGAHNTVGRCLVNHCVNDILCCGARPLFFLDYLAFGKLDSGMFIDIVSGFAGACEELGCALIGGETAEMPGFYHDGEYDISGTIVGIADRNKILDGSRISAGDVVIGLQSNGLHTNGYSLARKVFFDTAGYSVDSNLPGLEDTLGNELLRIHKCYFKEVYPLIQRELISGLAHITGGGILGNIGRLLPDSLRVDIDWNAWEWLPVFKRIQEIGSVSDEEMKKVFNLGIGLVIIASNEKSREITDALEGLDTGFKIIGNITTA